MIKQALQNAENSQENQDEKILTHAGELTDHVEYSEKETDIKIKTQLALNLETRVKELDSRVTAVPYNYYIEGEGGSLYLSSRGRFTSYKDKSYTIVTGALMEDNGKKASYSDGHSAHTYAELDFEKVVNTSLFHASNILREEPLKTGKYTVMFTEDCLQNLFQCFSNFYSAKSAIDKVNPWADKIGTQVISSDLTITDEPQYKDAFRRSLFDSEGVEQKKMTLVQNGVLNTFYHNSVTAKKLGTTTTGHASRGPSSSIGVSGTYMVINGKNKKSAPGRYLEVIQMDGLYSGANRVTGNFSVAIKGYIWENGQRVMTVGNCTLSGNMIDMLLKAEVAGDKLKASDDRSFFSVPLVFHDISVAGA
jgi:PmbA protein